MSIRLEAVVALQVGGHLVACNFDWCEAPPCISLLALRVRREKESPHKRKEVWDRRTTVVEFFLLLFNVPCFYRHRTPELAAELMVKKIARVFPERYVGVVLLTSIKADKRQVSFKTAYFLACQTHEVVRCIDYVGVMCEQHNVVPFYLAIETPPAEKFYIVALELLKYLVSAIVCVVRREGGLNFGNYTLCWMPLNHDIRSQLIIMGVPHQSPDTKRNGPIDDTIVLVPSAFMNECHDGRYRILVSVNLAEERLVFVSHHRFGRGCQSGPRAILRKCN